MDVKRFNKVELYSPLEVKVNSMASEQIYHISSVDVESFIKTKERTKLKLRGAKIHYLLDKKSKVFLKADF
jgi:hypothetical protein